MILDKWPNEPLKCAGIVGHTTTSTCQLWIRTHTLGEFKLLLLPKNETISFKIEDHSNDTITILPLEGLSPDTLYEYQLTDMESGDTVVSGSFKTIPSDQDEKDEKPFSFGLYSCHKPFDKKKEDKTAVKVENMEVWRYFLETVKDEKLRFIVACGDQLYIDGIPGLLDMWQYLRDKMSKKDGKLLPPKQKMLEMYRENYRYYWGFDQITDIFSTTPMYMIWDDHEIMDGHGSYVFKGNDEHVDDELKFILPPKKGLEDWRDRFELYQRMVSAGKQVYWEYQHSHNPGGEKKPDENDQHYQYDYSFEQGTSAFYVLDERGNRDINRNPKSKSPDANPQNKTTNDVLGDEQWGRFTTWLAEQQKSKSKFLFIVSSIPLIHNHPNLANATPSHTLTTREVEGLIDDDMRDSWAWNGHSQERTKLLEALFSVAKDKKVVVLSGDVHVASAYKLTDKNSNNVIYQLTSSGITYGQSPEVGWARGATIFTSEVELREELAKDYANYKVEQLGYWIARNYSVIKVLPNHNRVEFTIHQKKRQKEEVEGVERSEGEVTYTLELDWSV